eukprot:1149826-Pelagomonas_calceolata.AAC.1
MRIGRVVGHAPRRRHHVQGDVLCTQRSRHHVQGDVLKKISNLARTSQGHIFFYKVKFHTGIAGNECADRTAKYQASLKGNNLTDTNIPSAGPGSTPFYNIAWTAREEPRPSTSESSSSIPNLIYFPDFKDALKSHMHAKHRLGYADFKTGYYTYYQSLPPRAIKAPSIIRNMQSAVKHPLALYAFSQNVITWRHDIASRMIFQVVDEDPYGPTPVHMDVGSADCLAQHDLHITEQSKLFVLSIPDQAGRISSRPDAIMVAPCPTNPRRPPMSGVGFAERVAVPLSERDQVTGEHEKERMGFKEHG